MTIGLYKGYSSFEFDRVKSFRLRDIELVKMDLLNHIYTRRGERVNMPTFGTSIPDIVFEPLDNETLLRVEEELTTVFEYDPRVKLLEISVTPHFDENLIIATANLFYIELNMAERFELNIQFED